VDTLYEVYDVRKDVDIAWAQGAIGSSGGGASSSTTRIRTYYYSNTGLIYKVSVPAAYRVAAFLYNSTTESGYIGCWNGTTPVVGTLTWLTEIRLDAISAPYIRFVVSKENSGTIDVDESDVCAFYARTTDDIYDELSNVSEVIGATGNLIEKLLANATVDSATGGLVYNASYSVTNLIELPQWKTNQRYNPYTTLYAMSRDGTAYGTKYEKVVFYGSNKSVIDVITSGNITIPSGAVYVRVVFPASNTYCYVGCGILEELPPYQPFHHVVSNEYIPSIAGTIRNSDGAKTNLVKTALQYLGNTDFGYGNTHTAYSESAEAVESDGVTQADGTQTSTVCYEGTKFQMIVPDSLV
jgi:hypothetical protein